MTSGNNGGRRAVFFDRDGVLNVLVLRDGQRVSPRSVHEFQLHADAAAAADQLRAKGFLIFLVSNQPDVARGALSTDELDRMTAILRQHVQLDDIAICMHDDRDACRCRKPAPGMVVELARRWGVDLNRSFLVGDSWRDMEAGRGAGCTTILVARDGADTGTQPASDARVRDLDAAVQYIVSR